MRCLIVDGGGSGTRVVSLEGDAVSNIEYRATINPFAAGSATSEFADLLASSCGQGQDPDCVWVATAGVPWIVGDEHRELAAQARQSGLRPRRWVVSNDALLPLASVAGAEHPVVILAGTGSCVVAKDRSGAAVRLGGREYLLSDDGSSYAIGLAGLRLALHRVERGRSDCLTTCLNAEIGGPLITRAREVTRSGQRKQLISGVASVVLETAANDAELLDNVRRTVSRLATHALEAASRTGVDCSSFQLFGGLSANGTYVRLLEEELSIQANRTVSLVPLALDWAVAGRSATDPPPRWLEENAQILGGSR